MKNLTKIALGLVGCLLTAPAFAAYQCKAPNTSGADTSSSVCNTVQDAFINMSGDYRIKYQGACNSVSKANSKKEDLDKIEDEINNVQDNCYPGSGWGWADELTSDGRWVTSIPGCTNRDALKVNASYDRRLTNDFRAQDRTMKKLQDGYYKYLSKACGKPKPTTGGLLGFFLDKILGINEILQSMHCLLSGKAFYAAEKYQTKIDKARDSSERKLKRTDAKRIAALDKIISKLIRTNDMTVRSIDDLKAKSEAQVEDANRALDCANQLVSAAKSCCEKLRGSSSNQCDIKSPKKPCNISTGEYDYGDF